MKVLLVGFEMLGQLANPLTQNRNLDLRRTGVRIMGAEAFNQGCFLSGRQHGVCYSSCLLSPLLSVYCEITMNIRPDAIRRDAPEPSGKPTRLNANQIGESLADRAA